MPKCDWHCFSFFLSFLCIKTTKRDWCHSTYCWTLSCTSVFKVAHKLTSNYISFKFKHCGNEENVRCRQNHLKKCNINFCGDVINVTPIFSGWSQVDDLPLWWGRCCIFHNSLAAISHSHTACLPQWAQNSSTISLQEKMGSSIKFHLIITNSTDFRWSVIFHWRTSLEVTPDHVLSSYLNGIWKAWCLIELR